MSKQRQSGIGVTIAERAYLNKNKALYEKITEQHCDWGKFLSHASLLALKALDEGYRVVTIDHVTVKRSNNV